MKKKLAFLRQNKHLHSVFLGTMANKRKELPSQTIEEHIVTNLFWRHPSTGKKTAVTLTKLCRGCEKIIVPLSCLSCRARNPLGKDQLITLNCIWKCVSCNLEFGSKCPSCVFFQGLVNSPQRCGTRISKKTELSSCWKFKTLSTRVCCWSCEQQLAGKKAIGFEAFWTYLQTIDLNKSAALSKTAAAKYFAKVCDKCLRSQCPFKLFDFLQDEHTMINLCKLEYASFVVDFYERWDTVTRVFEDFANTAATEICNLIMAYENYKRSMHCVDCVNIIQNSIRSRQNKQKIVDANLCNDACSHDVEL